MSPTRPTSIDTAEFRILIVDDVEDNRALLSRRLSRRGFQVEQAASGLAALTVVASGDIDLVILDVMMPGMSGLQVLEAIRANYPVAELPIIMATARADSEDVVEALDRGANDYVTKPIDFPVLLARIMAALRTKAPAAPAQPGVIGPGRVLAGRYEIASKLGEGGFGAVFQATHLELHRPVAVKVLHPQYAEGELLERFRLEGINACRVNHPNALSVLDAGVTDDRVAYLVMELLEGHTLQAEMAHGAMAFVRCAEVLAPVCEALAASHATDVVHRDIKPANVFLHREGNTEIPKVLDFGIAKLMSDAAQRSGMTLEGSIVGTPAYMAPERFLHKGYDGKSDVYSVGILLHQMITCALPFASLKTDGNVEAMALAMMHTEEPPLPLRAIDPEIPEPLETLVLRALAKNPNDRPTASEFSFKLIGAVEGVDPRACAHSNRPPKVYNSLVSSRTDVAPNPGAGHSTRRMKKPQNGGE